MTQDQVLALIRAHKEQDRAFFRIVALQIAAHEQAKSPQFSQRVKMLVEHTNENCFLKLDQKEKELVSERATVPLGDVVLPPDLKARVIRIVQEHANAELLAEAGTTPRRKILLHGPPGSGKSMLARALAHAIGLPLVLVNLHALVGGILGETSQNVARLFQLAAKHKMVLLLDEIDAVAPSRTGAHKDVGEMHRVVSAVMQQFDNDESDSIFVATTNQRELIDSAMIRRFECVLGFGEPDADMMRRLIRARTGLDAERMPDDALGRVMAGSFEPKASLALLGRACDAAKRTSALLGEPLSLVHVLAEITRPEEDR